MEIQTVIDAYHQGGLPDDPESLFRMSVVLGEANDAAGLISSDTLELPLQELITQELALYHEIITAIGVKLDNLHQLAP